MGLTQEDVADLMGVVTRYYQKIEAGEKNLTVETLVRLSTALEVKVRDLF